MSIEQHDLSERLCECELHLENTLILDPERVIPNCGDMFQEMMNIETQKNVYDIERAKRSIRYQFRRMQIMSSEIILSEEETSTLKDVVHIFIKNNIGQNLYIGCIDVSATNTFFLYEASNEKTHPDISRKSLLKRLPPNKYFQTRIADDDIDQLYPLSLLMLSATKPKNPLNDVFK